MKKNNGITLIALVITIIVLLILAGVALAMISGNGGILGKASTAKVENEIGTIKDKIAMDITTYLADYYEDAYVKATAEQQNQDVDQYIRTKIGSTDYSVANVATVTIGEYISSGTGAGTFSITIDPVDTSIDVYNASVDNGVIEYSARSANS